MSKILSDIEIARMARLKPIQEIAQSMGLKEEALEVFGKYKAKLSYETIEELKTKKDGKLILVTSINPTPAGEGKSTVTVGLGDALKQLGKNVVIALREPSLGPVMGIKGGACGGGYAQVVPMEDINLHFTGDLHAISAANNTLASLIDNHIQQGNRLKIDTRKILWKRAIDINDRALRHVVIGLGGKTNGIPREEHFEITAASEMMAIFCLADDLADLKKRISRTVIAYNIHNEPVTVKDLGVEGALTVLLRDAIKPNLVQTLEHTPAIVHGGPFANIAHGCNSIIATKTALKLADYVVTEAGFGADLGAEKFLDIKCQIGGILPNAVAIVATIRALKMHGGVELKDLHINNPKAVRKGFANLRKHVETIKQYQLPFVISLNHFVGDFEEEIEEFIRLCEYENMPFAITKVWEKGGQGGIELADQLLSVIHEAEEERTSYQPLYSLSDSIEVKLEKICKKVYGASCVELSINAKKQLKEIEEAGWGNFPVCIAKTQYSLSDDPSKLGRPEGFTISIRELKPSVGAGFVVAYAGQMLTMPGLPKYPAALNMDVNENGQIKGLF
ncbi:formate--tetrahydrofolate ligase [Pallidibacillus thermolactis]|jgi:formate--tetrahydrofolate ligase|uniref:formate--tetrahydrofolate ligase n=1 Tax=Pallidibacillus thermolactis TaxID=251051 RepID=UPI0021DA7692|nr:formate--tetrahydrofolate ligase [Pallidibacillus thermolactis]MCU9599915.1 formate--tetrahydrofolate ligase [Pallidibacillus thermolactis subsp. kokeshiiformis]